jgi:hypothetical protein
MTNVASKSEILVDHHVIGSLGVVAHKIPVQTRMFVQCEKYGQVYKNRPRLRDFIL